MQQKSIVDFLLSQKRYRVLWWSFGPTIFEYLCKQKDFNAKELLEKHKNNVVLEKESLALLAALGEIKAYWWWPWSATVKEVVLSESQKERAEKYPSYFFLHRVVLVIFTSVLIHRIVFFQQSGGYMNRNQQFNDSEESSAVQIGQHLPEASGNLAAQDDQKQLNIQHLSFLGSAMVYNVELEWALHLMGFSSQTLSELDKSLARVREANYSKEAMEEYAASFKEIFTDKYRELARKVHSDKQDARNLSNIQDEKMKDLTNMKEVMNGLYEASKEKIAELRNVTIWRQADLLYCRNEFLKNAQELFEGHKTNLPKMKQNFEKLIDNYTDRYQKLWLDNLRDLKHRCGKDKNLNIIKDEVKKLLKEGARQLIVLIQHSKGAHDAILLINKSKFKKEEKQELIAALKGSEQITPDKCFILPMMVYRDVMKQLFRSYCAEGMFLHDIPYLIDVFKKNAEIPESIEFYVKQYLNECSPAKLQEWSELLTKKEGLDSSTCYYPIREFVDNVTYQIDKVLSRLFGPRKATRGEMKRVILIQILDRYIVCLKEEFKKEKTWFKKKEEEIQQIQEGIREKDEKIKQASQRAEQADQRAEQADQRVHRLKIEKTAMKSFRSALKKSKFDDELYNLIEDSEDAIVEAVTEHVIEHNSSPEQILNEVMGKIGKNKDDILSAEDSSNAINEVIEDAIRRFIVGQVTREMAEKVEEQETLRKRAIDLMRDDAFGIPIEEIRQNQDMMKNEEMVQERQQSNPSSSISNVNVP
ncbi:CAP-Gly domain-containing linker protein 1-like, partial [Sipha flava]|uniref:CAP-Gly domain-containing linker protein 1-like n=1 Tax=Sipha flava TaxID=143950 RepID=A0A8B8F642_9HEMI